MAAAQPDIERLMYVRSRALAGMYLTRRKGVKVQDAGEELGIDLLVTFPSGNTRGVRQLGVELSFTVGPIPNDDPNAFMVSSWPKFAGVGPFPFPVVTFFFSMRDEKGWYAWLAEPVITADGRAQLPLVKKPECHSLTDQSLEQLLDNINNWYDVHYDGLTKAISGRKREKKM